MARKPSEAVIAKAVDAAIKEERRRIQAYIDNYAFEADCYTFDVVRSVLRDVSRHIGT